MIQKLRKKLGCRKGFTLIELIVVIAILGILATVAIPKLTGFQQDAKIKADISNARMIASQAAILYANGSIAAPAADGTSIAAEAKLLAAMESGVLPVPQAVASSTFAVTMDKNGKVVVKVGTVELYPSITSTYGK